MAAKGRKVIWSEAATVDLDAILDYIAVDDPGNAARIFSRFQKVTSRLSTMPDRGRIVPELREHGLTMYRELVLSPWRIVYRTAKSEVFVLAVVDARRNVEDILLDRLARPES